MPNGLTLKMRPKGSQTSTPPRRNDCLKDPKARSPRSCRASCLLIRCPAPFTSCGRQQKRPRRHLNPQPPRESNPPYDGSAGKGLFLCRFRRGFLCALFEKCAPSARKIVVDRTGGNTAEFGTNFRDGLLPIHQPVLNLFKLPLTE